jgi:hypothetical protein
MHHLHRHSQLYAKSRKKPNKQLTPKKPGGLSLKKTRIEHSNTRTPAPTSHQHATTTFWHSKKSRIEYSNTRIPVSTYPSVPSPEENPA